MALMTPIRSFYTELEKTSIPTAYKPLIGIAGGGILGGLTGYIGNRTLRKSPKSKKKFLKGDVARGSPVRVIIG